MNIRLILGSLLVTATSACAMAAIPQIVINPGSADEKAVALSSISRIQFSATGMEINGNEDFTVPFADITRIVFSSGTSEISGPVAEASTPTLVLGPGASWLSIAGLTDPVDLEIYSVSGLKLMAQPSYSGEEINTSSLPADVYIVRAGNQYFKFIKH